MSKKDEEKKKKIERLISEGKVGEALELADIKDIDNLFLLGLLTWHEKNFETAEKIFTHVLKCEPQNADVWLDKGEVLMEKEPS